jgi:hypothetical protein
MNRAEREQRERDFREEAERLRLLPRDEQRAIIALHRSVANDREVSPANRQEARARVKALEKYLRLKPQKGEKNL